MKPAVPSATLIFVVATFLLIAGCTQTPTRDLQDAPDSGSTPSVRETATAGTDPGAVPTWAVGDWWTWKMKPRDSGSYDATTVVAAASDTEYLVGFTDINAGLAFQYFHFLPNLRVSAADLSFEAHNEPVTFLQFPLREGATWTGGTWLAELTFTATKVDVTAPGKDPEPGFRIHGENEDGTTGFDMLWSPSAKMFTKIEFYLFDESAWLVIDLVAFGTEHAAAVHVLYREVLIVRATSIPGAVEARSAPPVVESVVVPSGATHYSMGCFVGGAPGRYEVALYNDPLSRNGCLAQNTGDEEPLGIAWGELVGEGEWRLELTTLGEGYVFVELFLIRVETVIPTA